MSLFISSKKPYLLDPKIETDTPLPVFKSVSEILGEHIWWITFLALLLIGLSVIWIWKKRLSDRPTEKVEAPRIDPYAEAMRELDALQSLNPQPLAKPYVFKLSEILRLYVERKFSLPALEQTGEEFIREVLVHPFLQKNFEQPLRAFVDKGDRIKYSPVSCDGHELKELLESAKSFIHSAQSKWEKEQSPKEVKETLSEKTYKIR